MTTGDAGVQSEPSADVIRAAYWRKQHVSVEQVAAFLGSIDAGLEARTRPSASAWIFVVVALALMLTMPPIVLWIFASGREEWLPWIIGPLFVLLVANVTIALMLLVLSVAPGSAQRHEDVHIAKQLTAALEPRDQDILLARFQEGQYPRLAKFRDGRDFYAVPTFLMDLTACINASRDVDVSGDSTTRV